MLSGDRKNTIEVLVDGKSHVVAWHYHAVIIPLVTVMVRVSVHEFTASIELFCAGADDPSLRVFSSLRCGQQRAGDASQEVRIAVVFVTPGMRAISRSNISMNATQRNCRGETL